MIVKRKYYRTKHLPTSPGFTGDDERLIDTIYFDNEEVVVTEKIDGENSTIYSDGSFHARSIDSGSAPWRSYVATEAARLSTYNLPENMRICGENMYAKHSIGYDNLETYFYAFNIWEDDYCLPWKQTLEWLELLELKHPPIIYEGKFDINKIQQAFEKYIEFKEVEGYVVRRTHGFLGNSFAENVCKYVRAGHVTTDSHWSKTWVPNKLRSE
jgi:hypothetical protein